MARGDDEDSLGDILRRARTEHHWSLYQLARRVGKTPSYMCDIELDRRIPAEAVMADLARELELDLDWLMARAARLGEQAERYLKRQPEAVRLVRRMAQANLSEADVRQLVGALESLAGGSLGQPAPDP